MWSDDYMERELEDINRIQKKIFGTISASGETAGMMAIEIWKEMHRREELVGELIERCEGESK